MNHNLSLQNVGLCLFLSHFQTLVPITAAIYAIGMGEMLDIMIFWMLGKQSLVNNKRQG